MARKLRGFERVLDAPSLFDVGSWDDQDDATEAIQAALEGDATYYGMLAFLGESGALPDPADMQTGMESASRDDGALAKSPALVRLTLTFPYAYGYPLALDEGDALLASPPAST